MLILNLKYILFLKLSKKILPLTSKINNIQISATNKTTKQCDVSLLEKKL